MDEGGAETTPFPYDPKPLQNTQNIAELAAYDSNGDAEREVFC